MSDIVAVSGAAGFIGSAVVRKLLDAGRSVRALLEPGAGAQNLDDLPQERVERITVDICDYIGMARALDGCAAFYHLAAIYKLWMRDPRVMYRVNVEGTATALLAAQAAAVPRIVYTSSIAAVGHREDGVPSDESVDWNLYDIANDYILTKHLSERIALRFAERGLPVVVVNPGFPFGPRDIGPTPTGRLVVALLRGEVPALGEGGFCAIDVDDVAAGHVAAEAEGRVGERYILANHNVTYRDFAALVCEISGARMPKLTVPRWVGRGIVLGMELWSDAVTQREPLATYKSVQYLEKHLYFDATKARRELGLPCTPLYDSVERAVAWFRARGVA